MAQPLYDLISRDNAKLKKHRVQCSEECYEAFLKLKGLCTSTPVLAFADFGRPFHLHSDASISDLGTLLYQEYDGKDSVIGFASQGLFKSEVCYAAHKLEFLALKWAITKSFHEYLYGNTFSFYLDNNPLMYVLTTAKLDATGHCWIANLAQYKVNYVLFTQKQNIFLWKTSFHQFYKHGFLRSDKNVILCKMQNPGVWVLVCPAIFLDTLVNGTT